MRSKLLLYLSVLLLSLGPFAGEATASPWTLPQDDFALDLGYNFQFADDEYLADGSHQAFPLDGRFTSSRLSLGGRYGFTDRVEGAVRLTFKQVSYESTPYLMGAPEGEEFGNRSEVYDQRLVDFSETRIGAGDFHFKGRYNFYDNGNLLKLTAETDLKLPGGYEEPKGTFADGKPSPGSVQDDVTLGDGQVDLTPSLLFGGYLPATRTFGRVDVGYSFRFGPPGDQIVGGAKIGQNIGSNVIVFAGANGAYTHGDGESIGTSFITRSPELSARELSSSDIETIDVTLDKSFLQATGGIIFRISPAELQFTYSHIVLGENLPQIQTASVRTVFTFQDITSSDDGENEE